jgi:uncharacterized hydantoinase/oxoprolinase family protein
MRRIIGTALLLAGLACGLGQRTLFAQACQDDEEMSKSMLKDVTDLVGTVKKESLGDFEKAYHQKSYVSKAGFSLTVLTGLIGCLDKAAQDPTATKEQADAYKAKRDGYAKLKEKIEQSRSAVKSAEQKDAKTLIEKTDFSG